MKPQLSRLAACLFLLDAALAAAGTASVVPSARALGVYGRLPLTFEANAGQVDPGVRFLGRSPGFTLFLTDREAVLSLRGGAGRRASVLRVRPAGGAPRRPEGGDPRATRSNYLLGNDPRRWQLDVPHYGQVRYADVYPGIDLVYRGNPGQLEYDFVVAAGADPGRIRLAFQGAARVALGPAGELILHTASGDLVQRAPVLYQEVGRDRKPVAGSYVLLERPGEVGFRVGPYDRGRELVIDPTVLYATFLGGTDLDQAAGIAVDAAGNAYVTGTTASASFPVSNGSFQSTKALQADAFVTKIDATGTQIVYSTFLGGNALDEAAAIAVDGAGNAHVAGATASDKFPGVTATAPQPLRAGGTDGFVTTLNAAGNGIVFSTYLGGTGEDRALALAVDRLGNSYVTGATGSTTFTGVTPTSLRSSSLLDEAFVTKLDARGALLYSTFLGGNGRDSASAIAVDRAGNAYVAGTTTSTADFPGVTSDSLQPANGGGNDAFVTKINGAGTRILFSTFLGGSGDDAARAIALDGSGNAHVTGSTGSTKFPGVGPGSLQPLRAGAFGVFVTKINALGTGILYSTFLDGPPGGDAACCIAVDRQSAAVVGGFTASRTLPGVGRGSIQPEHAGGLNDLFVTRIDPAGTKILYSTFLGGPGDDTLAGLALDGAGDVYLAGSTGSATFTGVNPRSIQPANAGRLDAIVAKLSPLKVDPQDTNGCSVQTCGPGTYPCCTSQPVCRCRPFAEDPAVCTAGGRGAAGCSISLK